jgi:cation:H+ antiporter
MEEFLTSLCGRMHWSALAAVILVDLWFLVRSADWLVTEAVALSERSGISKMVIAATVISVGTTTPEVAISVVAALNGSPGLALGNAVGSIICDTGLILGLSGIIGTLRLDRRIVSRQGWIQVGAALALIAASAGLSRPGTLIAGGSTLPRLAGFIFIVVLAIYIWQSIRWARGNRGADHAETAQSENPDSHQPLYRVLLKLAAAIACVVISARIFIPAITEAAQRAHIPDSVIAATLVALGTSLPELITAITAVRRGHGEIAVGNVIGADILNVLFVAGAAAAVTSGGLRVGPSFFTLHYPAMLAILLVFRIGIAASGTILKRGFSWVLLGLYALYLFLSYRLPGF